MTNIIIFSRNRAIRLDALLRSMDYFWVDHPEPHIFFSASSKDYVVGYVKVFGRSGLDLHNYLTIEGAKQELLDCMKEPHTMILMDNDMFVRPFTNDAELLDRCPDVAAISNNVSVRVEDSNHGRDIPDRFVYDWRNYSSPYNDIMSFHGNMFRTNDIIKIIENTKANDVLDLELDFNLNPINRPKFESHYEKLIMSFIDYPMIDDKHLNDEWLKGKRIDITPFMFIEQSTEDKIFNYSFEWER